MKKFDINENSSWIKLSRKILTDPFWIAGKYSKGQAWVDLLLRANFTNQEVIVGNKIVKIERGQLLTSQLKLSQLWSWDVKTVRAYLNLSKKDGRLDYKTDRDLQHGYTLITIRNYAKFQFYGQLFPQLSTQEAPQENIQQIHTDTDTNNNDKNENNSKNENIQDVNISRHTSRKKQKDDQPRTHILKRIGNVLEEELGVKITNWSKQGRALNMMLKAKYTEAQIIKTIRYMAREHSYYSENGFDLMNVAEYIPKFKAMNTANSRKRGDDYE